ncbi:MAG: hypothetical protein ACRDPA_25865 [Solirubrobacteraceae bacterium]
MSARESRTRRAVKRVKEIWSDLDYAQRRAFEIRTGIPVIERRARIARSAEDLERLYAA